MTRTECTVTGKHLQREPAQDTTPEQPVISVSVPVSGETFEEYLQVGEETELAAEDIDVVYRYQTPKDESPGAGVISAADKITGRFIVEANTEPDVISQLVETAPEFAEETEQAPFAIEFTCDDDKTFRFDQYVLLVYGQDNSLLRERSLIPNNITV
jgi:hypothetical protein